MADQIKAMFLDLLSDYRESEGRLICEVSGTIDPDLAELDRQVEERKTEFLVALRGYAE